MYGKTRTDPGGGLSSDNEEEMGFPVFLSRYKHIGQSHKSNKSCMSTLKISKEYGPLIFLQSSKKNEAHCNFYDRVKKFEKKP